MTGRGPLGDLADPHGQHLQRLADDEGVLRLGVSFTWDVAAVLDQLRTAIDMGTYVYAYWPAGAERALLSQVIGDGGIPRIVPVRTVADLDALLATIAISDAGGLPENQADWFPLSPFARIEPDEIGSPANARYAMPSTRVLQAVIRMATWPGIPVLRGIAPVPFRRLDGTTCVQEGFDEASGWYGTASPNETATPAKVIENFARQHGPWRGSAAELLAEEHQALTNTRGEPASARWVADVLAQAAPVLAARGITCRRLGRDPRSRRQIWEIHAPDPSHTSHAVLASGNAGMILPATRCDPPGPDAPNRT